LLDLVDPIIEPLRIAREKALAISDILLDRTTVSPKVEQTITMSATKNESDKKVKRQIVNIGQGLFEPSNVFAGKINVLQPILTSNKKK
jgi:hypothetical protein